MVKLDPDLLEHKIKVLNLKTFTFECPKESLDEIKGIFNDEFKSACINDPEFAYTCICDDVWVQWIFAFYWEDNEEKAFNIFCENYKQILNHDILYGSCIKSSAQMCACPFNGH